MSIQIKIQKINGAETPAYAHEGDAGADLRSTIDYELKPSEIKAIPTGLMMAIPLGYVGLMWDKSGLAVNHGIHNLAGVIDSGYRGEIRVVLINSGKETFHIKKRMKISQILIQEILKTEFKEVESLDETSRGINGFGSTGMH